MKQKLIKQLQNKKKWLMTSIIFKSREEVINFFRDYIEILSDANYNAKQNETKGLGLKILSSKQMLQRLPIALVQVKADNNSEILLNEIRQIVYSLYQSKQITKKVYSNIIKSIQQRTNKDELYIYKLRK